MDQQKSLSFAQISNAKYIEDVYQKYLKDSSSVELSWRHFFEGIEFAGSTFGLNLKETGSSLDLKVFQLIQAYRRGT